MPLWACVRPAAPDPSLGGVTVRMAEGVLLTGVYGSGKSSVAEEIAYLLEQQGERYALLDLDYLSWAGTGTGDRAGEFGLMLQNLAAVAANYRRAGIRLFVLAYFARSRGEVAAVRKVLGLPLRVARLTVPLPDIERRLAGEVTSGRRDDLAEAAASIAAGEGAGVEDMTISNDRPVADVARDVMTFLGWLLAAGLSSRRSSAPNRAILARLFVGAQPADIRICRIASVAPVYLCAAPHIANGSGDHQFNRVIQIVGAPNGRLRVASLRRGKHYHQLVFGRRTADVRSRPPVSECLLQAG